jgi:hypothetical protein
MPVDKALLESCIAEAAGDDAEMATFLRERYAKNDALAAKFVGGFTRTSDYTQKSQALAAERRTFESQAGQIDSIRKALEAAEAEKNSILRELAGHRVSTAKARELMKVLQEKYQLTDEDLPGMSDLIETAKKGKPVDTTDDLDTRLASFETSLMKKMEERFVGAMTPELGSLANLPLIWNEINREHEELTGKRLTFAEQQEILKAAQAGTDSSMGKGSIYGIWQDKYQIAGDTGLRMAKRDERLKASWASERDAADAAKRSAAALEVVTPTQADLGAGPGISLAFKTKLGPRFETDPSKPAQGAGDGVPSLNVQPGQHVRQSGDRGPSAAQRAAAKFLEQRSGGGGGGGKKVA